MNSTFTSSERGHHHHHHHHIPLGRGGVTIPPRPSWTTSPTPPGSSSIHPSIHPPQFNNSSCSSSNTMLNKDTRRRRRRRSRRRSARIALPPLPLPPSPPPTAKALGAMDRNLSCSRMYPPPPPRTHHRKRCCCAGAGRKSLSHSDLNVSPRPPPCPLAWPATTNASPRPPSIIFGGRLDNIVGPTQDTRKGPNGRKLDATHRDNQSKPTGGTNAADRSLDRSIDRDAANPLPGKYWLTEPPLRCVANRHKTNSIRSPPTATGQGTRYSATSYPASIQGGTPGDRHPAKISGHHRARPATASPPGQNI